MRKSSPRASTKDRILRATLELANRLGVDGVTTRAVAETAGINEGNLYYHYRTREALFVGVFAWFEAEAAAALLPGSGDDPARYTAVLDRWFALTWLYRFLFRDALALQTAAPSLRGPLRRLSARLTAAGSETLAAMQDAGLLRVPDGERDRLMANIAIVSSYWISFLSVQRGLRGLTRAHLRWGQAQLRALYAPYLTEKWRSGA